MFRRLGGPVKVSMRNTINPIYKYAYINVYRHVLQAKNYTGVWPKYKKCRSCARPQPTSHAGWDWQRVLTRLLCEVLNKQEASRWDQCALHELKSSWEIEKNPSDCHTEAYRGEDKTKFAHIFTPEQPVIHCPRQKKKFTKIKLDHHFRCFCRDDAPLV